MSEVWGLFRRSAVKEVAEESSFLALLLRLLIPQLPVIGWWEGRVPLALDSGRLAGWARVGDCSGSVYLWRSRIARFQAMKFLAEERISLMCTLSLGAM